MQAKTFNMMSVKLSDLLTMDIGFEFGHIKQVSQSTGLSYNCLKVFTKYRSDKKHENVLMYHGKGEYLHADTEVNTPEDLDRLSRFFKRKEVPFVETTTITHA